MNFKDFLFKSGKKGLVAFCAAWVMLSGCSLTSSGNTWGMPDPQRDAELASAIPMPSEQSYETIYLDWYDQARARKVPVKLYLPILASEVDPAEKGDGRGGNSSDNNTSNELTSKVKRVPLIVFSHGLGGSREGYSYMGKYWAAHGYASLHVQHVGSDREIWFGNPLHMVSRLQEAAKEYQAIHRALDMHFALDTLLASEYSARIDSQRIAAAGHSYGANTTLLLMGAQVQPLQPLEAALRALIAPYRINDAKGNVPTASTQDGQEGTYNFVDRRIKAAFVVSAPPFHGRSDIASIVSPIRIPALHVTSTGDDIVVPGFESNMKDRVHLFQTMQTTSRAPQQLVVFNAGTHNIFTDRLQTGGRSLNVQIKLATRDLGLAFFDAVFNVAERSAKLGKEGLIPVLDVKAVENGDSKASDSENALKTPNVTPVTATLSRALQMPQPRKTPLKIVDLSQWKAKYQALLAPAMDAVAQ